MKKKKKKYHKRKIIKRAKRRVLKRIKKRKKRSKKFKKKLYKNKKKSNKKKIRIKSNNILFKIIRLQEKFTPKFKFNFNLDKTIQGFFQKIADKIDEYKLLKAQLDQKRKLEKNKQMMKEKIENEKRIKIEKQEKIEEKRRELKEEIKLEKERKKELQKFIRQEQAQVRKDQAEKQRKFLEQIRLEKKIEQFRKREELEIINLEKVVLSQERESYTEVEARIAKIKDKYRALRDQKIRERIEQLGIEVSGGENRESLLEKERIYNLERQKIEFALESFYRSAHSLVFQLNKRYIPKYLSILRTVDLRFETGEIFIKFDESKDEEWLLLIYIRDNDPEKGVVIEDKTNPEKNISNEFNANEIFRASDYMVDALTKLLDRERQKRKEN